jgi:uncharacterized Zn-finger protein
VDGKHVCHLCGKIYAHGNGLRLHIRTLHQGEQSYSCDSCPKRFGRPDSLVKHRRVHTRQQNFICEFCPRAFSQSSNLIKHRSIQHVDQVEWSRNFFMLYRYFAESSAVPVLQTNFARNFFFKIGFLILCWYNGQSHEN